MSYTELYLFTLGSIALISAGLIIFTVKNADKHYSSSDKRKKRYDGNL